MSISYQPRKRPNPTQIDRRAPSTLSLALSHSWERELGGVNPHTLGRGDLVAWERGPRCRGAGRLLSPSRSGAKGGGGPPGGGGGAPSPKSGRGLGRGLGDPHTLIPRTPRQPEPPHTPSSAARIASSTPSISSWEDLVVPESQHPIALGLKPPHPLPVVLPLALRVDRRQPSPQPSPTSFSWERDLVAWDEYRTAVCRGAGRLLSPSAAGRRGEGDRRGAEERLPLPSLGEEPSAHLSDLSSASWLCPWASTQHLDPSATLTPAPPPSTLSSLGRPLDQRTLSARNLYPWKRRLRAAPQKSFRVCLISPQHSVLGLRGTLTLRRPRQPSP